VQRPHRGCASAGNEDSTEEDAIGIHFTGRAQIFEAWLFADDWTEKIYVLDRGRPDRG
jgi:hypothetical protein